MSVTIDDIRAELVARLEADEYFTDLPVLDYHQKDLLSELQKRMGGLTSKGGKRGAFVFLEGFSAPRQGTEPPLTFKHVALTAVAIEIPSFNAGSAGTGKSAWDIAVRVAQVLDGYQAAGVSASIQVDPRGIQKGEPPPNCVAYDVELLIPAVVELPSKCALPILTADGPHATPVAITCATAGASIYYTTDSTYPWSGNTKATLYSSPITLSAAATIRAVAFKTGYIASDSALGIYT